ncbi:MULTISPECIES: cation transporter [Synechococcaceae]|uniref:cation transporter n=1 Tax=Synechococcaceae TaxID=1890426 RepID=UPI0008FF0FDE|nr:MULTISPECIES: cation transporter [Synechococcaceae]MCT4365638.1 cation diffusion facilitator family transporter [Candidatus Regnicoccus frigidus MAG-AL1]APD47374.1 hypothetical protein BM449_02530 [Synechococcus sp. SynAce01]MCT0202706.1 cation diffusion facilitator family transporter [Synechococcus sp. CS-603]MCT0246062.1 cation diffusion facilitator family transporter [Synechococcus sp. CS-601]MCT4368614.1 cation diffusion facilitator family transporter [Candidatus Regnicoccus frigidus MA
MAPAPADPGESANPAVGFGWGAERLSTRPATPRFTYGFGRSTQLASLVNAVLISSLLVGLTDWGWLDPLTAIGVGLAVAWSGWQLLRDALMVALRSLSAVVDVHHLHVWAMSTSQNALTARIIRQPAGGNDMELLHEAKQRLARIGIAHSTLQMELPPARLPPAAQL